MLSLIFALLVVAVSVYAIVDYKRLVPSFDRFYKRFGRAEQAARATVIILFLGVLLSSLYIVLQWVRHPDQPSPTFQDVGDIIFKRTEVVADQAGELAESGVEEVESWFGKKADGHSDAKVAAKKAAAGLSEPQQVISQYGGHASPPVADFRRPQFGDGFMDFNAGLGQYTANVTQWSGLYEPTLVSSDGKCHPVLKGNCPGDGGLLKSHEYVNTCNQVTVSPPFNLDSSVSAWTVV